MDRATMQVVFDEMESILKAEVSDPNRRNLHLGGTMARSYGLLKEHLEALEDKHLEDMAAHYEQKEKDRLQNRLIQPNSGHLSYSCKHGINKDDKCAECFPDKPMKLDKIPSLPLSDIIKSKD